MVQKVAPVFDLPDLGSKTTKTVENRKLVVSG